ncbi:hypothetical protein J31TS4_29290 [Paenibacillus sp. J31TS4]|uniref:hypothetical protein n=1 Tax=Paenibacillus sp. J31TS4 TaxID=2807195 RepID=UPI001B11FD7D|nr:hypothetical protein [Paenibacillus sp. J31TS4]GIP39649.1 hypothetical protein J31TS4_29290 [Paenibacillus sp. J31TS4]
MKLQDALFNWLQIQLVADARPDDGAARETVAFFEQVLREDHGVTEMSIAAQDATMVHVRYRVRETTKLQLFDREAAEQLLADIETHPHHYG